MKAQRGASNIRGWMVTVLLVFLLAGSIPYLQAGRDPGINQPGAAGNIHRDPGVNQPGAVGNVGRDPGINQPGVYGNRSYGLGGSARQTRAIADPGINQPGAVGNVGRDPGINQPGVVGNVRR